EYPYNIDSTVVSQFAGSKWYFNVFKRYRLSMFTTARELLWKIAPWKTKDLDDFVLNFKPDIIFAPCYGHMFMLRLNRYIKQLTDAPVISYISDDNFSLRQYSISPFFWLNRMLTRSAIKKTFKDYSLVYTMTNEQAVELRNALGANMKVLRKGGDFSAAFSGKKLNEPIKMVYAGGIYINRWQILAKIGSL